MSRYLQHPFGLSFSKPFTGRSESALLKANGE